MAQRNQSERARLQRLLELQRSDPTNLNLYRDCVASALQCAAFDVMVSLAQRRLEQGIDTEAARFDLANGLIGVRDYAGALMQLEQLPAATQAHAAVALNRGLCHFCLQQYLEARTQLEHCYAQGERGAGLLRLLLATLHHLGLMTLALPIAAEAALAAPTDGPLAGVLALLYLDAGNPIEARQWAQTALRLHPKSIEGRIVEATLLTTCLQRERARSLLQEVVAEAPEAARAWLGLGALALIDRDLAQAKLCLQRSVEWMPQHVGSWHVLAWAHLMSGELPAAEGAFDQAMTLDRNFAETHGGLAAVAALRGDATRALELMQVAARLDPDCLSASFAAAVLRGRAGDPAQAQRMVLATVTNLARGESTALAQLLMHVSRGRLQ